MRTLTDILNTIPETGWRRFSEAFWVAKANFVLNEIETALSGPFLTQEVAVPLVGGVSMYRIPDSLRKVQRIRWPSCHGLGRYDDDPSTKPWYEIVGKNFRLRETPTFTPDPPDRTVTQQYNDTDAEQQKLEYVQIFDPQLVLGGWSESQAGRAVILNHGDGTYETMRAVGTVVDSLGNTVLLMNGSFEKPAKAGQTALVTSNFILVEGFKRLAKFVSLTSESPIPDEWDRALAKGLRYYLEVQQDEGGANAGTVSEWYKLFRDDLDACQADYNNLDGDNYPLKPSAPLAFGALRRNRPRI